MTPFVEFDFLLCDFFADLRSIREPDEAMSEDSASQAASGGLDPVPIDPFAYTFSSWEQWENKLIPPPDNRPLSTSLQNPKVNLFSTSLIFGASTNVQRKSL